MESQPFQYEPLEANTIRLFRILPESTPRDVRCRLHHRSGYADGRARYVALSYCWGDPTVVTSITLNDRALPVAQNLFDWLQTIISGAVKDGLALSTEFESSAQWSSLTAKFFWVDAIPINQADIPERNTQVPQMWRVYANGDMVLSWLGPLNEHIAMVFRLLNDIDACLEHVDKRSNRLLLLEDDDENHRDTKNLIDSLSNPVAFEAFYGLEYWARLWIIPELPNGNNIWIMSGWMFSDRRYAALLHD